MSKRTCMRMFVVVLLSVFVGAGCAMFMENEISLDKVPAAAKAAIEKETAGGTIKEIEKKKCCGKVAYEVEYMKDGRKVEVKFTEDGSVMKCCEHGDKAEK
jgi:hypothetical protein